MRATCVADVKAGEIYNWLLSRVLGAVQQPLMSPLRVMDYCIWFCTKSREHTRPKEVDEMPVCPSSCSTAFCPWPRCRPVSGSSRVEHYHPIACRPCSTTQMCNPFQNAAVRLSRIFLRREICVRMWYPSFFTTTSPLEGSVSRATQP